MADLFVTLAALSPLVGSTVERSGVPAESPQVKSGPSGRTTAPTGLNPRGHVVGPSTRFLWRLDEAGGTNTVIDQVGAFPLPTATGVPIAEVGQINNGRHFNASQMSGPSDAATVSWITGSNDYTIGFWIRVPDAGFTGGGVPGAFHGMFTLCQLGDINNATLYVLFHTDESLGFGSSNSGNAAWANFFTGFHNQWIHTVLVTDFLNARIFVYRNGVSQGFISMPASTNVPTTPTWYLGLGQLGLGGNFGLDDMWFENTAWSGAQVLADYQRGLGL